MIDTVFGGKAGVVRSAGAFRAPVAAHSPAAHAAWSAAAAPRKRHAAAAAAATLAPVTRGFR